MSSPGIAGALAAAALGVAALSVLTSPAAVAAAPVRVGWWNEVSAQGVVAPAPTAPSGGMHVESLAGRTTAYGAVLFSTSATAGTLTLHLTASNGTALLRACPVSQNTWHGGDDQPASAGPGYDCTASQFPGSLSKGGSTVTFLVSSFGQNVRGQIDLAIVPGVDPATTVPAAFSADVGRPDAGAFAAAADAAASTPAVDAPAGGAVAAEPAARPAPAPRAGATALPPVGGAEPAARAPQVAAGPSQPDAPRLAAATRRADTGPNKAGLALAAVLLAVAGWIRFLPNERS